MTIKELIDALQKIDRQDLEVHVRVKKTMSFYTKELVANVYCSFQCTGRNARKVFVKL